MKTFIIYTPHKKSIEYANKCLISFNKYNGWEPEMFEGLTPDTVNKYDHISHINNSRAADFFDHDLTRYITKKSCSLNHYRLFNICVDLNEPIAIIEHDSHCIGDWKDVCFDDILVLNATSAIKQVVLKPVWNVNHEKIKSGINDIDFNGLNYRHNNAFTGAHIMPGTAAYAVTPQGSKKMISIYEKYGWEQSDFIINTNNVNIKTMIPEIFTFKLPNLSTSHGDNIL